MTPIKAYLGKRLEESSMRLRLLASMLAGLDNGKQLTDAIGFLEDQVRLLKMQQYEFNMQIMVGMAHGFSATEIVESSQGGTIRIDGPELKWAA